MLLYESGTYKRLSSSYLYLNVGTEEKNKTIENKGLTTCILQERKNILDSFCKYRLCTGYSTGKENLCDTVIIVNTLSFTVTI